MRADGMVGGWVGWWVGGWVLERLLGSLELEALQACLSDHLPSRQPAMHARKSRHTTLSAFCSGTR